MKTKNIMKVLVMAMLMPAMLFTACSKDKEVTPTIDDNTAKNGYELQVTVNVTRQSDDDTPAGSSKTMRAHYNEGTKQLEFSEGDKLFVSGSADAAGYFAGTLNYVSEGTFSGTIYTQNEYSGTADALFSAANDIYATLLPYGYESYNFLSIIDKGTSEKYDDEAVASLDKAFVASETAKAKGVEQFSFEKASNYSSGFALAPQFAILNFTIGGLEAGAKDVTLYVTLTDGPNITVTGSVTPNASGVATFAVGVSGGFNIKDISNNLTVGSHNFTLPSTALAAGKIYNITRAANAINGKFTINSSGDQVYFSKGNLRYVSGTWSFFDHQYDFYDAYSADAWDKFGWSTSSTTYGMSNSKTYSDYSGDFVDWGTVPGIGAGWYTLSKDEWNYLFNTRTDATSKYGFATISTTAGDRYGIIILPDAFVDPNKNKGSNAFAGSTTKAWNANVYTEENWALMEAAGAVFLPAAGYRSGASVGGVDVGYYWSSLAFGDYSAYSVYFYSNYFRADNSSFRSYGYSVRLVRQVK